MEMTELGKRQEYYQRRQQFEGNHRPSGNKNIRNRRIRNRQIKVKKILLQFRDVEVKHRVRVVRRMIVWRKTFTQVKDIVLNIKINSVYCIFTV